MLASSNFFHGVLYELSRFYFDCSQYYIIIECYRIYFNRIYLNAGSGCFMNRIYFYAPHVGDKPTEVTVKEEIIELLNEYYGNSRNIEHKEEIADFIESNTFELFKILNEEIGDLPYVAV